MGWCQFCKTMRFHEETAACTIHSAGQWNAFGSLEEVPCNPWQPRQQICHQRQKALDAAGSSMRIPMRISSWYTEVIAAFTLHWFCKMSLATLWLLLHLCLEAVSLSQCLTVLQWNSNWPLWYSAPHISVIGSHAGFTVAAFLEEWWLTRGHQDHFLEARVFRNKSCQWDILKQKQIYADIC